MRCKKCGAEFEEGRFCPECGTNFLEPVENISGSFYQMAASGSTERRVIRQRSFWKYILLSFVTCGIYQIYALWEFTKDMNEVCQGDGKNSPNYIVVMLLSAVTFGIYGLYWWYTQGERLHRRALQHGIVIREKGSTILLWNILGCTVMPGIGIFVATYIMFDNMNRIALVYNGEVSREEIEIMGKPHPHLVRNVFCVYGIAAVLLVIVGILLSSAYGSDEEAENIVRNGVYAPYTEVTIGEVFEYNWEDGQWDSFTSEENGRAIQVVEYARNKGNDSLIQFEVNTGNEEFSIIHFREDGKITISAQGMDNKLRELYFTYFNAKYPISELDMANYVGRDIKKLLDDSNAFYESDKELLLYEDVSRQVSIMLDEEYSISVITIKGDGGYSPMFAGNKTGGSLTDMNLEEIEKQGYTIKVEEGDFYQIYGNPENKAVVMYEGNENGNIESITWMSDTLDDSILGGTMDAEYIFPDSDKRYLSEDEIRGVGMDKLPFGRNEIYARHGYIFQNETFQKYFKSTSWYQGTVPGDQFNEYTELNEFEKKNIELIKIVEDGTNEQEAINKVYNFVVGKKFYLEDGEREIEFANSGEFIAWGYYGTSPGTNKYCTYSFSAEYIFDRDSWKWMVYVNIDGVDYYIRCFDNASINLSSEYGEFDGWYLESTW